MAMLKLTKKGLSDWYEIDETIHFLVTTFDKDRKDLVKMLTTADFHHREKDVRENMVLTRLMERFQQELFKQSVGGTGHPDDVIYHLVEDRVIKDYLDSQEALDILLGVGYLEPDLDQELWRHFQNHVDSEIFNIQYFVDNEEKLLESLTNDQKMELIGLAEDGRPMEFLTRALQYFGIIIIYKS